MGLRRVVGFMCTRSGRRDDYDGERDITEPLAPPPPAVSGFRPLLIVPYFTNEAPSGLGHMIAV